MTKKGKSPAYQMYPADWLSDDKILMLTRAQKGDFITLLQICWLSGGIPSDPEQCQKMTGGPIEDVTTVMNLFSEKPGDATKLINKRQEVERENQAKWRLKSSKAGKKSAKKRWGHT